MSRQQVVAVGRTVCWFHCLACFFVAQDLSWLPPTFLPLPLPSSRTLHPHTQHHTIHTTTLTTGAGGWLEAPPTGGGSEEGSSKCGGVCKDRRSSSSRGSQGRSRRRGQGWLSNMGWLVVSVASASVCCAVPTALQLFCSLPLLCSSDATAAAVCGSLFLLCC